MIYKWRPFYGLFWVEDVPYLLSLDASLAQMFLGIEPKVPGHLLGHPDPPLKTIPMVFS